MGKNIQEIIDTAYTNGFHAEQQYRGCAQCVISAMQDALGVKNDAIYQAGSALAGGGAECGDGSCGSYAGGLMMISAFFGRSRAEEANQTGRKAKYDSFRLGSAFHDKFVETYGTVICRDVHKKLFGRSFDLRNDEDKQQFREAGAHEDDDKCCAVVGNGAKWATEIILHELTAQGMSVADFYFQDGDRAIDPV
ncbi:MAG: C_GCAxxG_C_C family protein [Anaerolineaceae bacterium]|nr:C_GCAxxG_C_C family protein [Anaerolineaceae bacterium]